MSSSSAKATKKSAFSCEPCRRRKVKCGGEQPVCNRCASRKEECLYKLNPTLSYTQRLENRIKELEDQVARISKSPSSTRASSSHSSPPSFSHQDALPAAAPAAAVATPRYQVDEPAVTRRFRGLKMDDNGAITYHGATSFFHLPMERPEPPQRNTSAPSGGNNFLPLTEVRRERLVSNAWQQRALENLSEIPEPFLHLLNVHWCWIQPLFNYVYRPTFTRDMQSMGPYYSHTLLNAMLTHSMRWGRMDPNVSRLLDEAYEGGAVFGKHARSMVFEEISNGVCTVPTVQSLLLLSAQECNLGNTTQAWTYSGLAFRLIDHLGVCVDGEKYSDSVPLSDEDIEIRHRLFWSCYLWDKMISLYLGRAPSIQHSSVSPPQVLFDNSAENELWVPFGAVHNGGFTYQPMAAHAASCFTNMCQLSVIFNEILIHMYDPLFQNTDDEVMECLHSQEIALQQWWDQLPPFLRIDGGALPDMSPPSHIVTLNCLYHTFRILLYRPMLTRGIRPEEGVHHERIQPPQVHNCLVQCVSSATSIIAIFNLFCKSFTSGYSVLSLSYSVYIASTIYLLQVQASIDGHQALQRLQFCMKRLEEVTVQSPMIGSALSSIHRQLSLMGISSQGLAQRPQPPPPPAPSADPSQMGMPLDPMYGPPEHPGMATAHPMISSEFLFQADLGGFGPDLHSMEHDGLQTMSSLEPLSPWLGTLHDFDHPEAS